MQCKDRVIFMNALHRKDKAFFTVSIHHKEWSLKWVKFCL